MSGFAVLKLRLDLHVVFGVGRRLLGEIVHLTQQRVQGRPDDEEDDVEREERAHGHPQLPGNNVSLK